MDSAHRERIHSLTTANRLLLADLLDSLDEEQWEGPTLCAGWGAQEMAAHLVQPMLVGFGRVFVTALRFRGDTERTVDHITRRPARRSRAELVGLLRVHAGDRLDPPRVGPMGPYVDTCVHLRDLARPLGLGVDVPPEQWRLVLDYLTGPEVVPALLGVRSVEGLRLRAVDVDWAQGEGLGVEGPAEALAMVLAGRSVALADLRGEGVEALRVSLVSRSRRSAPPR